MKRLPMVSLFAELTQSALGQSAIRPNEDMPVTQKVSLCSVLRRPRGYRSKLVEIRADVLLAMPDGAALFDRACPKRGIALGVDLPKADASAVSLVPSILNDCSSALHPQGLVAGTFVGKLSYFTGGRLNLRLSSARELDVIPCIPPIPSKLRSMPSATPPT